jgi:Rha family phage regulatory protein
MKLVFIDNSKPVTDSLTVADSFNKDHARVLRDIRELGCSEEFRVGNFAESVYLNNQGRETPKIIISEQGFSLLAMGYTGKKAMEFKEKYISEFHNMRSEIDRKKVVPLNERQALVQSLRLVTELADEMEEVREEVKQIREAVEEQITIDHGEQRKIQKAVGRRVYEMESEDLTRRELFPQLYREIKDRWAVASYRDVRRNEIDQVIQYIEAWKPKKVS